MKKTDGYNPICSNDGMELAKWQFLIKFVGSWKKVPG